MYLTLVDLEDEGWESAYCSLSVHVHGIIGLKMISYSVNNFLKV